MDAQPATRPSSSSSSSSSSSASEPAEELDWAALAQDLPADTLSHLREHMDWAKMEDCAFLEIVETDAPPDSPPEHPSATVTPAAGPANAASDAVAATMARLQLDDSETIAAKEDAAVRTYQWPTMHTPHPAACTSLARRAHRHPFAFIRWRCK